MTMKERFYITTAIAYSSRKPHIGNTYEIIMTDAIARYKRKQGYDVYFLTGTDEHGQKIENCAAEAGITPKEYVDGVAGEIKRIWDLMDTSYDKFIRTTDDYHERAVQAIFKKLYDKGDIYKSEYEGWYCEPCEAFLTDTQTVDGKCPDCGREVKRMKEESYFFRMSAYQDRLMQYIDDHPEFIEPEARKKEMVNNFLKPGLQDLCVSRSSFKWGVPVTFDDKHVIYVWIDALSNYITALGYNPEEPATDLFKKNWPADVHIIGKDIMRFHTIYWPIILMALDLPLPKKVFGHPWLNIGADKMSKSKGNSIYADDLADVIGVDAVREYVLAEMPYLNDGSITFDNIIARYNMDLANNLGNLVNRTLAMTTKYFGGIVPAPDAENEVDADLKVCVKKAYDDMVAQMDAYRIADAVETVFGLFRRANKYIDETTPWTLAKNGDTVRLGTVLYNLLETIRVGAVMVEPFMPGTSGAILAQIGTACDDYAFGGLVSGRPIGEAKVLFSRLDEKETLEKLAAMNAPKEPAVPKPEDCESEIAIDHFMGVELRTAQVIACEPIPKAKKLLKLQLDLGYEKRQVASGIAKCYKPEDLIGKKLIVVANLKPAVLCGVESNGMILASGEGDKIKVVFLDDDTPLGQRVR
ncbi:MAG: methionine--tRNA ligase [Ruminococcaceae bacterium]|nr:methionine--tRNA ligase [Oscillospiraceae bacterium]